MVKESDKMVEANSTYLEWILEAVQKIKHQKQRPNKERIVNAIRQNHQVTEESIVEQLEFAVRGGQLLRVENNNDFTYKDPASASQSKSKTVELDKKTDLTKIVLQCLRESRDARGLMLKSIEKYISSKYSVTSDDVALGKNLHMCIRRAVQRGRLVQSGRFIQLPKKGETTNGSSSVNLEDANFEVILPFERNRVSYILFVQFRKS